MGGLRLVINLKPLNLFVKRRSSKWRLTGLSGKRCLQANAFRTVTGPKGVLSGNPSPQTHHLYSSVLGRLAPQSHVKSHLSGTHPDSTRESPGPGLPSELGQVPDSEVCLPLRGLQSSNWTSQTFRERSRKGSGPLQSTAQTTLPDGSLSPSAVRGSQLSSRHHSLWAATHCSMVHGVTTIVLPSETQRSVLSPPRVVGGQTQSDMQGSPHFPQNVSNIVYGQLNHGLRSNPRRRRLCFRDLDSSRGRRKHKVSRDDGDLSGIEPLLISGIEPLFI